MLFKKKDTLQEAQVKLDKFLKSGQFTRDSMKGDKPYHLFSLTNMKGESVVMFRTEGKAIVFMNGRILNINADTFDQVISGLVDL